MWAEAILLVEDLDRLVAQFTPLTVTLGAGRLQMSEPGPCVPVPGEGVRVTFKATAHWPVLGIDVPVAVRSLSLLLRPEICGTSTGEALVFQPVIEDMDMPGFPRALERKLTAMVNRELVRKDASLSWGFTETLTHSFRLPGSLAPVDALNLTATAGRVEIRSDGMRLAVSFTSAVMRAGTLGH
jgi:hypothetical protein